VTAGRSYVAITELGECCWTDLDAEVRRCHLRQLGHLSQAELETLTGLLRKARAPQRSGRKQLEIVHGR